MINNNRTLLDAPVANGATTLVPTPVLATSTTPLTATAAAVPTATSPAGPTTTTAPIPAAGAAVTTTMAQGSVRGSVQGSGALKAPNGAVIMANGSVRGSLQGANGAVPGSLQGAVPGSLRAGSGAILAPKTASIPPASVHASVQGSGQLLQQPMQQSMQQPLLPEPMLPSSQPVDTKQEIVENYLNSLPQNLPPASSGGHHFMGNRYLICPHFQP
jgi:hypothetical protein